MTKEDKELLLKDLCARLPYNVTVDYSYNVFGVHDENILYDWYNKNHFDYRGLIEKGLAIDATGLNIY